MVHLSIPEYVAIVALAVCAGWLLHQVWRELQ